MDTRFASPDAIACIQGGEKNAALTGIVEFYQKHSRILVVAHVCGLPPEQESGFFGFHIHEGQSCGGHDFSETGGHYNPAYVSHPRHAGDLPPLLSCGGEAYLSFLTDRFSVREVLGRTVVIHSGPDDFRSQPGGRAGEKIACGLIRSAQHIPCPL